jgi:two-component system phosphate regulon response regulator PhoB
MADKKQILVVEDEADILELIRYNLEKEGYHVRTATSGEKALEAATSRPPTLIVLDLMLPGMDGLELSRLLRKEPATELLPIVMVTAKGEEADIVAGLELGADDYITKPFSPRVLIARIRSVLRRGARAGVRRAAAPIRLGGLMLDPGRKEVRVHDAPVSLTFTEFHILEFLARRPGWVFTRAQIVEGVRGDDYPVTDRAVDVQIVSLRKKLAAMADHIETVRGVGYRFKD